jgi:hypothetical protein
LPSVLLGIHLKEKLLDYLVIPFVFFEELHVIFHSG